MVEVMKRMKEQFKAKEQENAGRQKQQHNQRYGVRAKSRPAVAPASSSTRNNYGTNHNSAARVQMADERVWNRGNDIVNKSRIARQEKSHGYSANGEVDYSEDSYYGTGEHREVEMDESVKGNNYNSRTITPRPEINSDNRTGQMNSNGNAAEDEEQYSFVGTAGRRIDQAVMEALQISRGVLYLRME